ncbi:hypothetical protein BDZ94DRAFT_1154735 [Collybia nuda]|uniref:Uncharacterized protein n=1 Tax=Collybia nuda TaxID=64659 RepID=A0A9P6CNB3_9AGAR|nr:hypothetical protein BDZ94DRAFT_1154735 [Collybia nuda]
MSELDSLSDSDWLDIASNRGSDDNDSIISGDSDRDETGFRVPLSRRSSMSIGSSREGDVEAWEGFVDDSGDEDALKLESADSPAIAAGLEATIGEEGVVDSAHDLAEEQRVKAALDQSLISTLSASRSSSASTHTSLRDLRLSFPDPLSNSHDELHRSYDDVSPSENTFSATDIATDHTTNPTDATMEVPLSTVNPDTFTTTPEVTLDDMRLHPRGVKKAEFEVFLYGRTSSVKWSFVRELVKKAIATSGRSVIDMSLSTTDDIRLLRLKRQYAEPLFSSEFVPVHDWTDGVTGHIQDVSYKPSLAIVYLPSLLYALPSHTLYVPVFVPPPDYTGQDDIDATRMIACEDWETLRVPSDKVLNLNEDLNSPVFDVGKVNNIHHFAAHQILQRLLTQAKKGSVKSISEHLNSVHAVTLFALMSLIVGFAINTTFRVPPSTPTPTIEASGPSSTFWGMFGPEVNRTAATPAAARANVPAMTAQPKDFSLSIINTGTTSLAITSKDKSLVISATPIVEGVRTLSPPIIDKVKLVRDVIIRPSTQLSSIDPKPSMSSVSHDHNAVAGPSTEKLVTGLSLRVVGALSEVLDVKVKTLVKSVQTDLDELIDSLDELSRAISHQTQTAIQRSKGKAKAVRERVYHRNDKARGKAKELKKRGEKFLSSAGKHLKGKTTIAKQRARDLTQTFSMTDTWKMYRMTHAEWVVKLKDKGRDRGQVCSRRSSTRSARICRGAFRSKASRV